MEITDTYLIGLAELMKKYEPIVRNVQPLYPAMTIFTMTTEQGDEEFILGCNTDSGNWAIESMENPRELAEFSNSKSWSPIKVDKAFRKWLANLVVVIP